MHSSYMVKEFRYTFDYIKPPDFIKYLYNSGDVLNDEMFILLFIKYNLKFHGNFTPGVDGINYILFAENSFIDTILEYVIDDNYEDGPPNDQLMTANLYMRDFKCRHNNLFMFGLNIKHRLMCMGFSAEILEASDVTTNIVEGINKKIVIVITIFIVN